MTQWSTNDQAVIEDALRQAMANETDYQAILAYQEVLNKIQGKNSLETSAGEITSNDGFRYDYDDASDVY